MNIERAHTNSVELGRCKICRSERLDFFAHTAKCKDCGVVLNYPYALPRENDFVTRRLDAAGHENAQKYWMGWYVQSGERNHFNFTHMAQFALTEDDRTRDLVVLDYGGGGGQFALVMRSLFPRSTIYISDMNNDSLLDRNKSINRQILFADFDSDQTKFDVIFMNDVFEHVTDPVAVLKQLKGKLNPGGRIFIDTPCSFWMYYAFRPFLPRLQEKILRGLVNADHQQIWSRKSFTLAAEKAGFSVVKMHVLAEYTQGVSFYLGGMGINSTLAGMLGRAFVLLSPWIGKNKIMAVLR